LTIEGENAAQSSLIQPFSRHLHPRADSATFPGSIFPTQKRSFMPRVCYFTGKKTSFGNQITHRGKAKYLGGVGTKTTGITARKFKANIQKVRAVVNGRVMRIKVSAKAIRNGMVVKPVRRKREKAA
jgi:large subunit ribosomal protein L28